MGYKRLKKNLSKSQRAIYDEIRDNTPVAEEYEWFKDDSKVSEEIKEIFRVITLNLGVPNRITGPWARATHYTLEKKLLTDEDELFLWRTGKCRKPEQLNIVNNKKYYSELIRPSFWGAYESLINFCVSSQNYELLEEICKQSPHKIVLLSYKYKYLPAKYYRQTNVDIDWDKILEIKKRLYIDPKSVIFSSYDRITASDFTKKEQELIFTEEYLIKKVKLAGSFLKELPSEYQTEAICLAAVKKSGSSLKYVISKYKTPKVCEAAITSSPSALRYIPEELQSSKLILKAMLKNIQAKKYIKGKR